MNPLGREMMKLQNVWRGLAIVGVLSCCSWASAADWGDLKLKLVLDGKASDPAKLTVNKDVEVCGKMPLFDEKLVVNKANNGIANVFVMLVQKAGDPKLSIHPDYEKTAKDEIIVDNKSCRFEPHVTVARTTQTVILRNSDTVGHNVKAEFLKNAPINPIIPAGGQFKATFKDEERLPIEISCSIHPWMTGRLLVRDNPYTGVSDADGNVVIKNLPAGKWNFLVWQEKAGYIQEAKQGTKAVKWAKGRMEGVTIKKGDNDLGTYTVPASVFAK